MSSKQIETEGQQHAENIGSRVARKLSKRMSLGGGSKETASKEGTDQSGIGQQALDKGEQVKDQAMGGNFKGDKDLAGKESHAQKATSQGDAATALGSNEMKNENANRGSIENVGRRMFGSVSVGPPEPNDDIKKGPIFPGPGDQRSTGNTGSRGAGSSAQGGLSQNKMRTTQPQGQTREQAQGLSSQGELVGAQTGSTKQYSTNASTTKSSTTDQANKDRTDQLNVQSLKQETQALDTSRDISNANEAGEVSPTQKVASSTSDKQDVAAKDNAYHVHDASKSKEKSSSNQGFLNQAKERFSQTWGGGSQKNKSTGDQTKSSQGQSALPIVGLAGQGSSAGGNFGGDESLEKELSTQAGISDDVFSDGTAGKSATKGVGQGLSQKSAGQASSSKSSSNAASAAAAQKASMASKQNHKGQTSQTAPIQRINKGGALGPSTSDTAASEQKSQNLSKHGGITMGGLAAMSGSEDSRAFGTSGAALNNQGLSQQGLNQGAASRGGVTSATTGGSATGASSTRVVQNLSGGGYRVTVLQEKVQAVNQKSKTQLGLSANEILQRSPTVDAFFDAVAAERLRWMPRDGSRLDCSLRWASRLAYAVDALRESVGTFAPGANEAAKMIWGFLILLLEVRHPAMIDSGNRANRIRSLILTTPISSRVSSADMAALLWEFICCFNTSLLTSHLLSFSQKQQQLSQIFSRWSVPLLLAVSKVSRVRNPSMLPATMWTQAS